MDLNKFFDNCIVYQTVDKSAEWLEQRKTGIGGSEAGIILKKNKYKTPYQLFMEKKGNAIEHITSAAIEKGNRLEGPLIDMFYAYHPAYTKIDTKHISLKSKMYAFMNANLDGAFIDECGEKHILEIKTTTIQNKDMAKEWGYYDKESEVWLESIPDQYYCQVLHYMATTGIKHAVVFASIEYAYKDIKELREFEIHYDDVIEDIRYLIEQERVFWTNIETNTPPPFMEVNFK